MQNIKGIFNNFVKKDFFYTALSLFAVTEQGLNVTGHLSSALYLYECKLHRTEPVLQVVLLHALVALKKFLTNGLKFSMVYTLIDHRNDVIKCSKLKWKAARGSTAKF